MSHVVLSTIIFILLVTKTSSSPLDTTTPTQSQSEPSFDRVKNSKSIVLILSVIAIVLIVSILAYVSLGKNLYVNLLAPIWCPHCGVRHLGLQITVPGTGQSAPSLEQSSAVSVQYCRRVF